MLLYSDAPQPLVSLFITRFSDFLRTPVEEERAEMLSEFLFLPLSPLSDGKKITLEKKNPKTKDSMSLLITDERLKTSRDTEHT